ncbi:MAG: DUF4258 domain-containing protein, partial [Oscillospiraceae bacterium]|nr:DUF4258 domain-containing protein [Oscillospiraceae bacterium]
MKDVITVIQNGEIIENYPTDYPFPSYLILGLTPKNNHMHTVCGVGDNKLWIITAYFPSPNEWEN